MSVKSNIKSIMGNCCSVCKKLKVIKIIKFNLLPCNFVFIKEIIIYILRKYITYK